MAEKRFFSDDAHAAYRRDGFIVVRGLIDAEAMREVAAWTDDVQAWPETPGKWMKYFDDSLVRPGERLLNRIENFCPYHAGFDRLAGSAALQGRAGALFGELALLFKDKINFKLPGGGGFEPHQDMQAGWDRYGSEYITALVSVDKATLDNGCLEIAAGHHRAGLIGESWRPLGDTELAGIAFEPCPTEPGDAVFFDSLTPHRSAPNMSDTPRRVLYITYGRASEGDSRARYYADKRASYPPDIEREPGREYVYKV